jgi:dihydrofolate reductase
MDEAMARAKEAAGEKDVLVRGVGTARLALAAGVLDELQIHLIPVLLGEGRRLFEGLGPEHIELERTRVLEGESGITHLRYRVQH